MKDIPILILAAGASSRMGGRDKLLEPVTLGLPLLTERLKVAKMTGQQVLVALPPARIAKARWNIAETSGASCITIENPALGLSATLGSLIREVRLQAAGALVLPADMPDITEADMRAVLAKFDPEKAVRGCGQNGQPGHPVLFPRCWFARLQALCGDKGARGLLTDQAEVKLVKLPAQNALTDLDTMQDWARWRRAGGARGGRAL